MQLLASEILFWIELTKTSMFNVK